MSLIKCDMVGMRYGSGEEVLKDICFSLEERSFCFLTGPSGAGKSTLLRLLFLAQNPTRGLITLFGRDAATLARHERAMLRRRIGVIFQDFRLIDHANVYENVMLPLRISGQHEKNFRKDVRDLIEWVGLGGRENAYPPTLSGGEKQRVAIARAVAAQPDLVIADEPTGSVDPLMAERLLHLLTELNRLGTAVLIATHDPKRALEFKSRIMHLENGRLHGGASAYEESS